jgi:hypothetical protein
MRDMAVHFYGELEVVRRRGVPVPQLRLLWKLIKRRIDFNRVKESGVLLQVVARRVIKDASPMIVMPSAAAQIDLVRFFTLASTRESQDNMGSYRTDKRIAKV